MADLRLEVEGQGFYIEPLTEEGLKYVNEGFVRVLKKDWKIGDHVQFPMVVQDMVVQEIAHAQLVLSF